MSKRTGLHGEDYVTPVNFQKQYQNALMCPVPRYTSLQGAYECDENGAKYFVASEFLELPMARTRAYNEYKGDRDDDEIDIPARIDVRETLCKYHHIKMEEGREVFWVKFDKTSKGERKHRRVHTRWPKLRGPVTLRNGHNERKGRIHYVARRPELKLTAVVVVDF